MLITSRASVLVPDSYRDRVTRPYRTYAVFHFIIRPRYVRAGFSPELYCERSEAKLISDMPIRIWLSRPPNRDSEASITCPAKGGSRKLNVVRGPLSCPPKPIDTMDPFPIIIFNVFLLVC